MTPERLLELKIMLLKNYGYKWVDNRYKKQFVSWTLDYLDTITITDLKESLVKYHGH